MLKEDKKTNSYIKEVLWAKQEISQREEKVIQKKGVLPLLTKANTVLPPLMEVIVKAVYLTGGMFLTDIKKMVCFYSDIQKTERAIGKLITEGYLVEKNTPLGKLYGLSAEGIKQIRFHPAFYEAEPQPTQAMSLDVENALLKKKLISSLAADHVFQSQTKELYYQFFRTEKLPRNIYLMELYLKNIVFREFLELGEAKRKEVLTELDMSEEIIKELVEVKGYNQKAVKLFVTELMEKQGFENLKADNEQYRKYIAYIKSECMKAPNENTYYLLREMYGNLDEHHIIEILLSWKCNLLKYGMEKIWNNLAEEQKTNPMLHKEKQLEICNQYLKWLGDERRSHIQRNAYKNKTEGEELKFLTEKIETLERVLEGLRARKESLEMDFGILVLQGYDDDGNSYEEKVITFKRLEQNAVFMEKKEGKKLLFYVIQTQEDYFDLFTLHKKLGMLWQLVRRIFPLYEIEIQIITHTEEQKGFILSKLPSLEKKLLASRETAFLGNMIKEIVTVKNMNLPIRERYVFYHNLLKILKGSKESES